MTEHPEIPELPGHFRVLRRRLIAAGLIALSCVLFGVCFSDRLDFLGLPLLMGFVVSFAVGVHTLFRCRHARCPQCGTTMTQGWNAEKHRSTGLFACRQCGARWRTDAIYSYGG